MTQTEPRPTETQVEQPKGFIARYGGNIAGMFYVPINITWIAAGVITESERDIQAGTVNLVGGLGRLTYANGTFLGFRNFGTRLGGAAGFSSTLIVTYEDALKGDGAAISAIALMGLSQYLDFDSEALKRRFADSQYALVRNTLGQPRFTGGIIRLGSRLPIIVPLALTAVEAVATQNWGLMTPQQWGRLTAFSLLAVGDSFSAASQPAMAKVLPPEPSRYEAALAKTRPLNVLDLDETELSRIRPRTAPQDQRAAAGFPHLMCA